MDAATTNASRYERYLPFFVPLALIAVALFQWGPLGRIPDSGTGTAVSGWAALLIVLGEVLAAVGFEPRLRRTRAVGVMTAVAASGIVLVLASEAFAQREGLRFGPGFMHGFSTGLLMIPGESLVPLAGLAVLTVAHIVGIIRPGDADAPIDYPRAMAVLMSTAAVAASALFYRHANRFPSEETHLRWVIESVAHDVALLPLFLSNLAWRLSVAPIKRRPWVRFGAGIVVVAVDLVFFWYRITHGP